MDSVAFVLGNGTSRASLELKNLRGKGTIYGCNAIYRDFDPDYIIAVDTKMVLELNKHNVQHRVSTWTNQNRSYQKLVGFNFFNPSKGWSSGPTALWKACKDEHKIVYIFGFDYVGLNNNTLVNNLYAGTQNYKKEHERATYHNNWLKQTIITIQAHPEIHFYRVTAENGEFIPEAFSNLSNLDHIGMQDFKDFYDIL